MSHLEICHFGRGLFWAEGKQETANAEKALILLALFPKAAINFLREEKPLLNPVPKREKQLLSHWRWHQLEFAQRNWIEITLIVHHFSHIFAFPHPRSLEAQTLLFLPLLSPLSTKCISTVKMVYNLRLNHATQIGTWNPLSFSWDHTLVSGFLQSLPRKNSVGD